MANNLSPVWQNLVMFLNPQTGAAQAQPAQVHTAGDSPGLVDRQPLQVVSGGWIKGGCLECCLLYATAVFTQHTTAISSLLGSRWADGGYLFTW